MLNNEPRANNGHEGWNRSFRLNFSQSNHPRFSKAIEAIQNEERDSIQRLRPHEIDPNIDVIGYRRKAVYVRNDEAILRAVQDYDGQAIGQRDPVNLVQRIQFRLARFFDEEN